MTCKRDYLTKNHPGPQLKAVTFIKEKSYSCSSDTATDVIIQLTISKCIKVENTVYFLLSTASIGSSSIKVCSSSSCHCKGRGQIRISNLVIKQLNRSACVLTELQQCLGKQSAV